MGLLPSGFRNATGQIGTVGSILETAITLAPGEKFSFDWAFLGNDVIPYNDFALFYLKDPQKRRHRVHRASGPDRFAQVPYRGNSPVAGCGLLLRAERIRVSAGVKKTGIRPRFSRPRR